MASPLIHVLILDDDTEAADYVRQLLALDGRHPFVAESVANLAEALNHLAQEPVDVLVVDMHLHSDNPLQALAHLRAAAPELPLIGMLRRVDEPLQAEALRLGVQKCFIKTWIQASELADMLRFAAVRHIPDQMEAYLDEVRASEARLRDLIMRHPDGILAVDEAGTIQFVNPAAEQLFGRAPSQLFGQEIGFPVILGNTSLVDVVTPEGTTRTAEIRVMEMLWEGAAGFLLALRDVSARRSIPAPPDSELLYRAALEAMPQAVAVLNAEGVIQYHNQSWGALLAQHVASVLHDGRLGDNYVALCQQTADVHARHAAQSMLSLLRGEKTQAQFDYDTPNGQWFTFRANLVTTLNTASLVVTHSDITLFKQSEDARHASEQAQRHTRELQQFAGVGQEAHLPVTEQVYGLPPLRENYPDVFAVHVRAYSAMLEQAIEHQVFDARQKHSRELQAMADELGRYLARPRDVIDLHLAALRQKVQTATPHKVQAYTEEGRWMALELMGHLASCYRQIWLSRAPGSPASPA